LNCSSQCSGYEEGGATQQPTAAQKRHNQEFVEYVANAPIKREPFVPSKVTPISPVIVQNNAKNIISQPANKTVQSSGCGCSGSKSAKSNYTTMSSASYVR
jgi:hypothetical protein